MNRYDLPHRDPRPHLVKTKPVDDVDAVIEWGTRHWFCAACGRDGPQTRHHLIGGRGGRSDEACNLLSLCWEPCHQLAEGLDIVQPHPPMRSIWEGDLPNRYLPKITLGIALSMKIRVDPAEYDSERMQVLNGRQQLPDPEPIPQWFEVRFRKNRPEFFQLDTVSKR